MDGRKRGTVCGKLRTTENARGAPRVALEDAAASSTRRAYLRHARLRVPLVLPD